MRAAVLLIDLHLADRHSLKEKRAAIRPLLEGLRRLASLSVAEVDHHDAWQRAAVGVAVVAPDAAGLERVLSTVRRYLDNQLEVEVLSVSVSYWEGFE